MLATRDFCTMQSEVAQDSRINAALIFIFPVRALSGGHLCC